MMQFTRRDFMGTVAASGALAVGATPVLAGSNGLVLAHRGNLALANTFSTSVVLLEQDIVRHWRSGLAEQTRQSGGATAYVPWAEAMILAGLAREYGGQSRVEQAGSVFVVTMQMTGARR